MTEVISVIYNPPYAIDYPSGFYSTFDEVVATKICAFSDASNNVKNLTLGATSNIILEARKGMDLYFSSNDAITFYNTSVTSNIRTDVEVLQIKNQNSDLSFTTVDGLSMTFVPSDPRNTTNIGNMSLFESNNFRTLTTTDGNGFKIQNGLNLTSNLTVADDIVAKNNIGCAGNMFSKTYNVYKDKDFTVPENSNTAQIAYAFYINEHDQLDLVKYEKSVSVNNLGVSNASYNLERVLTFGQKDQSQTGDLSRYTVLNEFNGISGSSNGQTTELSVAMWGNTSGSSNIYYNLGNVGINTLEPKFALDVYGEICTKSNVYAMTRLGVATSNPEAPLHVEGRSLFGGNIIPTLNEVYDLGSEQFRWRDLYLSGGTINMPNAKISEDPSTGEIQISKAGGGLTSMSVENLQLGMIDQSNNIRSFIKIFRSNNEYKFYRQDENDILTHYSPVYNVTTKDQYVGINNEDPQYTLDVDGVANVTGNMIIGGDLIVGGATTTINTQTVLIEDNVLTLNSTQVGTPLSSLVSGIEVNRGTESNFLFAFQESSQLFKVGKGSNLQAVCTRDDSLTTGYPYYDSSVSKLTTRNITLSDVVNLTSTLTSMSNFELETSNNLYPKLDATSNAAYYASNLTLKLVWTSNAANFSSNLQTTINSVGVASSFSSNAGAFGSNTAVYASNLNPAVTWASNATFYASNAAFFASNLSTKLIDTSNVAYFASNLSTKLDNTSNTAYNAFELGTYASNLTTQLNNTSNTAYNAYAMGSFASNLTTKLDTTSNVAYLSSNAAFFASNLSPQVIAASNAAFFASNLSTSSGLTSNVAYYASNLTPQLIATSNAAFTGSNVAYTVSNVAYFASNMSSIVTATSNVAYSNVTYASNLAVAHALTSNVAYFASNLSTKLDNVSITACNAMSLATFASNLNTTLLTTTSTANGALSLATTNSNVAYFASNLSVTASNTAYAALPKTGGVLTGTLTVPNLTLSNITLTASNSNLSIGGAVPTARLHVYGTSNTTALTVQTSNNAVDLGVANSANEYMSGSKIGDVCLHSSNSTSKVLFGIQSNVGMVIESNLNIGIGLSNPTAPFHFKFPFSPVAGIAASVKFTNGVSNNGFGGVVVDHANSYYGSDAAADDPFVVKGSKTWFKVAKSTGYVGVNTSNPGYTLDVSGDINFTGALLSNGVPWVSGGGGAGYGVGWSNASSNIYSMSNIGIGTSNPTAALEVSGNVKVSGSLQTASPLQLSGLKITKGGVQNASSVVVTTSNISGFSNNATGIQVYTTNATDTIKFVCSNAEVARFNSNGYLGVGKSNPSYTLDVLGNIYASQDIIAFSDQRIKDNLQVIPNALSSVCALNGYTYTRKDLAGDKRYAGLLAQEVENVLPEVVYEDNNGFKSISYGNIASLMVEAIKDLKKEIDLLKGQV